MAGRDCGVPQEVQKAESAETAAPHLEQYTLSASGFYQSRLMGRVATAGRIQQETKLFAAFFQKLQEMLLGLTIALFRGCSEQDFGLVATFGNTLTCPIEFG